MAWLCSRLGKWLPSSRSVTPASSSAGLLATTTPVHPIVPARKPSKITRNGWGPDMGLTFTEAFGCTGVVMLLVIFISLAWTIWLVIVGIHPNAAINFLMRTSQFDDGMMWLIVNAKDAIILTNAISLMLIAIGYIWLGARMTWMRNKRQLNHSAIHWKWVQSMEGNQTLAWMSNLLSYSGPYSKIMNALNKAADIVVQAYSLHSLLEAGYSGSTCIAYAALVSVNSLSGGYFILTPIQHLVLTELFCDTIFDMLFAVGVPIQLLMTAAFQFNFDRNRAEMYLRYFPAGWFDRETRLVSDAAAITAFRISFDGMRTQTWPDLIVLMCMNVSFCFRFLCLVEMSLENRRIDTASRRRLTILGPQSTKPSTRSKSEHSVPRVFGLVFVAAGVAILSYAIISVNESEKVCGQYSQCVAFAHRWQSNGHCPCRAMIDMDRAPTSWEQWTHPTDVTDLVRTLGFSGDLKVLQIVNRQLRYLPNELHRCKGLQQLVLMYTGIDRFPDWTNMFPKLELIAIEGQPGGRSLLYLPDNMFSQMESLMYVHFGVHPHLPRLPFFEGLSKLKTISFAMFTHLTQLPDVAPLKALERVVLVGSHNMYTLSDFSRNHHLVSLIIGDIGACCNDYFGTCKVPSICEAQPIGKCMNTSTERPTAVAQSVFDKYSASVCTFPIRTDYYLVPVLEVNVRACNGVLYRRCRLASSSQYYANELGMCYSDRMMVIACMYSPPHEAIRREEISRGIGSPCDPIEEKWLGCNKTSI